jgi:abhydrolase domain-containing protein 17
MMPNHLLLPSLLSTSMDQPNTDVLPCLFLPYLKGSNKLIIFFHGNAEDIGISYEMLDHMRTALKINVLAVEYPGYGVYADPNGPSEQ